MDGDFKGDGVADMALPVPLYGGDSSPAIMVFYGPFPDAPDWSAPAHRLELDSVFSLGGLSGLSAGDFTGDGTMDLAFDTHGAGIDVHIWDDVSASDTATLGSPDTFSWSGAVDDGGTMSLDVGPTDGDFDGDGSTDLVHVGPGAGELSLQFGPFAPTDTMEPDLVLRDPLGVRSLTHSICVADFDGDGRHEVGAAARRWDESSDSPSAADDFEAGAVELWVFEPADSVEDPVLKLTEGENAQVAGYACTDVDGDGQVDVLMQRPWAENTVGYTVGAVHLFFGALEGTMSEDSADHVYMAESTDNHFGTLVTTGDLDDDGYDELFIGGRTADIAAFDSDDWRSEWWSVD